jgi:hypothetical protein
MRLLLAIATACVLGCSSTTITATPWGTVNGIAFAPVDSFFLASAATNGDYNFIVFAVDQVNYCNVLQQNANAYLANMNVATFTYSNPVGTGQFDPALGTYPVTAAPGTSTSAQVAFQSFNQCNVSQPTAGTSGSVVLSGVAVDLSQISGSANVGFGGAGSLAGNFNPPLCDLSNSFNGPAACVPN